MIAPVGLRTDCRAGKATDHCSGHCATTTADRAADASTNTGANKRAADCVILCAGSGRHRGESRQSRKSEKGLPHGILQPMISPLTLPHR
jgi:hypothetical protein